MDDSQRRVSDLLFYIERLQSRIRELMAANTKLKRRPKELEVEVPKNLSSPTKKTTKKKKMRAKSN